MDKKTYSELRFGLFRLRGKPLSLPVLNGYISRRKGTYVVHQHAWFERPRGDRIAFRPVLLPPIEKTFGDVVDDAETVGELVEKLGNRVREISENCHGNIAYEKEDSLLRVATEFARRECGVCRHAAAALVHVLREVGVPSYIVYGFHIDPDFVMEPHAWIVYYDWVRKKFFPFDPLLSGVHVPVTLLRDYTKELVYPKTLTVSAGAQSIIII